MQGSLTEEQRLELVKRGFSRRTIARVAAMVAAGGVLPFYNESAMAQLSEDHRDTFVLVAFGQLVAHVPERRSGP